VTLREELRDQVGDVRVEEVDLAPMMTVGFFAYSLRLLLRLIDQNPMKILCGTTQRLLQNNEKKQG